MILENRRIRLDVSELTGAIVSFYLKEAACEAGTTTRWERR